MSRGAPCCWRGWTTSSTTSPGGWTSSSRPAARPVSCRPCAVSTSISTARSCAATIPPCCWRGPNCPRSCHRISAKPRWRRCCKRRWWMTRWSCATRRCSSCSTPPDCGSPSWWGSPPSMSACARGWCGWSARATRSGWFPWGRRRCTGWSVITVRGAACCWGAPARMWCSPPSGPR